MDRKTVVTTSAPKKGNWDNNSMYIHVQIGGHIGRIKWRHLIQVVHDYEVRGLLVHTVYSKHNP